MAKRGVKVTSSTTEKKVEKAAAVKPTVIKPAAAKPAAKKTCYDKSMLIRASHSVR